MKKLLLFLSFLILLFVSGCTKSSDIQDDAFFNCGLIFNEKEYDKLAKKVVLVSRDYVNLPSSYSLKNYTPKPKSQGNYGTCVAWASTYAGITTCDSICNNVTGDSKKISENAFSPYYLYRKIKPNEIYPDQTNGMQLEQALDFLQENGVPKRDNIEDKIEFKNFNVSMYENADLFTIDDYTTLFYSNDSEQKKIQLIKKSISEKKPVLISFRVTKSFEKLYNKKYWKTSEKETETGYHAMLLIGYDDNYNISGNYKTGAFLLQNSWGTDWGDKGYIWVGYSDFSKYCRGAYEMSTSISSSIFVPEIIKPKPTPKPTPTPKPNPEPSVEKVCVFKGSISLPIYLEDSEMELKYNNSCYQTKEQYESGTRFQIYMTNQKPCYVYAFASDSVSKKVNPIFPLENTSALLDYSENTIAYPSEDTCIELDNVTGVDYLIVLYSLQKLDLDNIMNNYIELIKKDKNEKQDIFNIVKKSIGEEKVLSRNQVEFNLKKISFNAMVENPKREMILPIVIKISHVAKK